MTIALLPAAAPAPVRTRALVARPIASGVGPPLGVVGRDAGAAAASGSRTPTSAGGVGGAGASGLHAAPSHGGRNVGGAAASMSSRASSSAGGLGQSVASGLHGCPSLRNRDVVGCSFPGGRCGPCSSFRFDSHAVPSLCGRDAGGARSLWLGRPYLAKLCGPVGPLPLWSGCTFPGGRCGPCCPLPSQSSVRSPHVAAIPLSSFPARAACHSHSPCEPPPGALRAYSARVSRNRAMRPP